MGRSKPDATTSAEIVSLADRLEQAALARDYAAVGDLNDALRQQAVALAQGRHAEAVDVMSVAAVWTALAAIQKASTTVVEQRKELVRRRGRARVLHLHYGRVDKP